MERSTVYFTDFHVTPREPLPRKLHRLMKSAGFEEIDFTAACLVPAIERLRQISPYWREGK